MLRSVFVVVWVSLATPVAAQAQPPTFERFPTNHPIVHVMDDTGIETTGQLLRFEASSLTITTQNGEVSFDQRHVRTVDRRDSVTNGVVIGAIAGAVFGGLGAAMMDYCSKPSEELRRCGTGEKTAVFAIYTLVGTGLGFLLDRHRHGRTRLFEAAGARRGAALMLVPMVTQTASSLSVSIDW
jgi:hypothetical protein